jgi:hypothetical protein
MTVTDIPLLVTSIAFLITGIGLLIYWAKKAGFFDFLRNAHYYSLALLIVAGILTWLGMIFPVNPDKFQITQKQWAALGFSICISVLWWARFSYSIAPDTEVQEE